MAHDVLTPLRSAPSPEPHHEFGTSWLGRYAEYGLRRITETTRRVVLADSQYIATRCVRPVSESEAWDATRVRTGAVVGAVQSGKTASMLGTAAVLLDQGIDILIILSGTQIALWKQTYERLLRQLDGSSVENADERWSARVLVPSPAIALVPEMKARPTDYANQARSSVVSALRAKRPVIIVIPKIEQHILAVGKMLMDTIAAVPASHARPVHMVVMDDEADDASVLDASDSKTIPRRIEMLWASRGAGKTASPNLYATYVAYTATPQANFLQESLNPLTPRHFCISLRSPHFTGESGDRSRTPTFLEPEGLRNFYCGGDIFYRLVPSTSQAALCPRIPFPTPLPGQDPDAFASRVRAAGDRMLLDGLRAYLVAGGVRLLEARANGKLLPSQIPSHWPSDMSIRLPPPHSMLVHPSAKQDSQREEARRLICLAAGVHPDSEERGTELPADGTLPLEPLRAHLAESPADWSTWLERYKATLESLRLIPGSGELYTPPSWAELAQVIRDEVIPTVRIRLINSDPMSDERPVFEPAQRADGSVAPPPDLMTIFVSGNVMSRGLTIEGLCTTVFTRSSNTPAADTQMQMQRWFGYRGTHLHVCRVFTFEDQLALFQTYHDHDCAMRAEILASMNRGAPATPTLLLHGPRSLATAKIPTGRLPLHPGATPSIKLIEADDGPYATANVAVLADALEDGTWVPVGPADKPRGLIRTERVSLGVVAGLLDKFRYREHCPPLIGDNRYARWRALEDQLGLPGPPLFRPPATTTPLIAVEPRACPYSIAAYLRLWEAILNHPRADGLFASDKVGVPWSLDSRGRKAPEVYLGVAFGEAERCRSDSLAKRGIRPMIRGERGGKPRIVKTLWGRRGEQGRYFGDPLFDYNYSKLSPPSDVDGATLWRPQGHPGLLLFHVVSAEDADYDAVTVGLALPHGGPEQFAAIPTISRYP